MGFLKFGLENNEILFPFQSLLNVLDLFLLFMAKLIVYINMHI